MSTDIRLSYERIDGISTMSVHLHSDDR